MLQAEYFEAACTEVDPVKKEVVACFPEDTGMDELCFRVPYDILVLGGAYCFPIVFWSPDAFQTLVRPC